MRTWSVYGNTLAVSTDLFRRIAMAIILPTGSAWRRSHPFPPLPNPPPPLTLFIFSLGGSGWYYCRAFPRKKTNNGNQTKNRDTGATAYLQCFSAGASAAGTFPRQTRLVGDRRKPKPHRLLTKPRDRRLTKPPSLMQPLLLSLPLPFLVIMERGI